MPQIVLSVIQSHIRAILALFSLEMPRECVGTTNDGREMLQSVGVSITHKHINIHSLRVDAQVDAVY